MRYVGMVTDESYMDALRRIEKKYPTWFDYYARKACKEVEENLNKLAREDEKCLKSGNKS